LTDAALALGGRVVTGTGFLPGERVTVVAGGGGALREVTADPDGSFRLELEPPRRILWIRADGDRGSRAALVVPPPTRVL
jgi:hypothetical protein